MKKAIALVMAVLMIVGMLAGCGSSSQPAPTKAPAQEPAPAAAESTEKTEAPEEAAEPVAEEPATKFPEKDIEVVCPFSAGGGTALTAVTFSDIIMQKGIAPVNLNVVYKPGGSCAVAMAYTAAKRGDPYYLLLVTPAFVTTPLSGDIGVDLHDFTPICIFGIDSNMLVVPADSPFQDFTDVIEFVKNGGSVTCGGAAAGGANHTFAQLVFSTAGIDYTYVPYSGGADGVTACLGGHIDMTVSKPTECGSSIESGQLRVLGVANKERLAIYPDGKTFVEQGVDVVEGMFRGVVAPGDIPEEERQILIEYFRQLVATDEWKEQFVDKYLFTADPLFGDEAKEYLENTQLRFIDLLKQLDMYEG